MKLSTKAQASLDRVVQQFQQGDLSPVVQIACIKLADDAPAAKWSFSNRVLAYAQTGGIDCRGYRQWQAVGRQVPRGQGGGFIFYPKAKKIKGKNGDKDRVEMRGFGTVAIWSYEQTVEGEGDSHVLSYEPAELPPLTDVAQRLGVQVSWQPLPPDRRGEVDKKGAKISLGVHDPKTWFHELGHAVHARLSGGELEAKQDEEQETVAEFTATVLMHLYGFGDRTGNCWEYIQQYSTDPIRAIAKALDTVQRVLEVIGV